MSLQIELWLHEQVCKSLITMKYIEIFQLNICKILERHH